MSRSWLLSVLVVLMVTFVCLAFWSYRGHKDVVAVRGTVTLDGELVRQGAVIFFSHKGKGNLGKQEVLGRINDDGTYELANGDQPGVPPGWYQVSVVVMSAPIAPNGMHQRPTGMIPWQYSNPSTSGLEFLVNSSAATDGFNLTLHQGQ